MKTPEVKRSEINGNEETDGLKVAEHLNNNFVKIAKLL